MGIPAQPRPGARTAAPRAAVLAAALAALGPAGAQAPAEPQARMTAEEFLGSLEPRRGTIELPGGIATLELPPGYYYLSPADAERVLTDAWGNPSGEGTLGMVIPGEFSVLDPASWAVIVSYEEDGHVEDDDAASIDYDELLATMREEAVADSEARVAAGYEPIRLVGWASPPRYDSAERKLYWAKELQFGDDPDHTLNYNVRVLGRKGVLLLNMVAGMHQLDLVERETPAILAMTNFTTGNRYSDFDPDLDEVAAYGIGALIAGKVAAKAGLFAKLGVLLLALKKFWIIAVVAIGAFVTRLFRGKRTS